MISISQPHLSDAAMLAVLGKRTFEQAFSDQNTPENMNAYVSIAYTTEQFEKELQDADSIFYVARVDDVPVGYAKLRKSDIPEEIKSPAIELQRIYVLQESLGLGIGKLLMEQCLQIAKQRGFNTLWLGVWEHNTRAIAFYQKSGFETFGSHVFQLGDDPQTDLLMKRNV